MNLRSLAWVLILLGWSAVVPVPAAAQCTPEGDVQFICGLVNPEDAILITGTDWVIASRGSVPGNLHLINVRDRSSRLLYPEQGPPARLDRTRYPSCPGPLQNAMFRSHGISLRPAANGVATLYVVGHGARESIEVFELDTKTPVPSAVWIGCVVLPPDMNPNSVASLPDGGLVVTNFSRGPIPAVYDKLSAGEITGNVQEWHAATGWRTVPGSDMSGPNGIEVSRDGTQMFVSSTGGRSILRFSRTGPQAPPRVVKVNFLPDNLRWTPDGQLLVVGLAATLKEFAGCGDQKCHVRYTVARVDPDTLQVRELAVMPGTPAFGDGTAAIQVGNELWVGTMRGDRIARIPIK